MRIYRMGYRRGFRDGCSFMLIASLAMTLGRCL